MNKKVKIVLTIAAVIIVIEAITVGVLLVVRHNTESSYAYHLELAQKYLLDGDYEEAIAEFEIAIEISPKKEDAYTGMADAYIAMGDYESAVEILNEGYDATASKTVKRKLKSAKELMTNAMALSTAGADEADESLTEIAETATEEQLQEIEPEVDINGIFAAKLEELVAQYGVFDAEQSGVMYTWEDEWFNPKGIMSATIYDFDLDGQDEMLLCVSEEYLDNEGTYHIVMYMWEIEDGAAVLADSIAFSPEGQRGIILSASYVQDEIMAANVISMEDGCYIFCEDYEISGILTDAEVEHYWAVEYKAGKLQRVCSYLANGQLRSEYTGLEFENGSAVSSQLYYSNDDYGDVMGEGLYDDYGEAITAFFEQYGIYVKGDEGTRGLETQLSSENNMTLLFELITNTTDYDWNSSKAISNAVLNRGSDALEKYAELEEIEETEEDGKNAKNLLKRTTSYYSNVDYELVEISDWTEYSYDSVGNMIKTINYGSDGSVSSWNEYSYDKAGNMLKKTYYKSNGSISSWNEYSYDKAGNLIKDTCYSSDGNVSRIDEYSYGESGNVLREDSYDGNDIAFAYTEYSYNDSGNVLRKTSYFSDGSLNDYMEYSYDAFGNMIMEETSLWFRECSYDDIGRLSMTYTAGADVPTIVCYEYEDGQ